MRPSEYLRAGKAKIDTPEKWTKGANARDAQGCPRRPDDPMAVCFCTNGALKTIDPIGTKGPCNWALAVEYVRVAMGGYMAKFNDSHDHADVMAAWDRAIAAAERDEAVPA